MTPEERIDVDREAKKHGKLQGHIRLTIADLHDLLNGPVGVVMRSQLNIIRNRLVNALREDKA